MGYCFAYSTYCFFTFWLSSSSWHHLKSLISSSSNASTHFHVKTASIQNVLKLLISLTTFRHFYNKGRKDVLKFFTSSFIKSAMPFRLPRPPPTSGRMEEENRIRVFFPFSWDKRFLTPKSTEPCAWKVMQKRLSLKPECSMRHRRAYRLTQPSQHELWSKGLRFALFCVLAL